VNYRRPKQQQKPMLDGEKPDLTETFSELRIIAETNVEAQQQAFYQIG
jgi:hypothetical protein